MQKYIQKAKILAEALPYIKEFAGITVVIKYGGSALINGEIKKSLLKDIAVMKLVGFKPVIIHGGGPEVNAMLKRLDIESRFVNGLRVTDEAAMEVVEMVLAGKVNKELTTDICLEGVNAVGISGRDGNLLRAEKFTPEDGTDLGLVGEVVEVNTGILKTLMQDGYIPVISSIAADAKGNVYNINADYAAVSIAGALKAEKLVFLTDVPGIMRDKDDISTVFSRLKKSEALEMIKTGAINGGMIPKVECCVKAVEAGVKNVHILDGRMEHSLLLEIFTHEGIGTLVEL